MAQTSGGNNLFSPYRALGLVSNHIGSSVQTRGNHHFVTTCVGDAFHIYNCAKLNLVSVGNTGAPIDCVVTHDDFTYVSSGKNVSCWKRARLVREYEPHTARVHTILPFGSHIVTVAEDGVVRIINARSGELYAALEDFDPSYFTVSAISHPSTYLNKILLGSRQGRLQLWNIKTKKMLFEFTLEDSPVTVIEQSTAVDVLAIGYENGQIVLHNVKFDKTVLRFEQEGGPITSISFRTDGEAIMATSNTLGSISLWDLEKQGLHSIIHNAHGGSIHSVFFLTSQPLLLSVAACNSMKIWAFDGTDSSARILRHREGHSAPPTKIQYYGGDGRTILSCGHDRSLRSFNIYSDARTHEFSQGAVVKQGYKLGLKTEQRRLTPIVDFAAESAREREWDNVVTCHLDDKFARTWHHEHKKLGKFKLQSLEAEEDFGTPNCVAMSPCGNFTIVGYTSGHLCKYNVQSGQLRLTYGQPAHSKSVQAVVCDALNKTIVTISKDRYIKAWGFSKGNLLWKLKLTTTLTKAELHRESNLLATAATDFVIRVLDIQGKRIVRVFSGHENRVTAMSWSPDARWLVSSAMDSTVRVWDVPSGRPIWHSSVPRPATSLSFSETGDFLATTHVGSVGIYLWANRVLYEETSLKPLKASEMNEEMSMPGTLGPERIATATLDEEEFTAAFPSTPDEPEADVDDDVDHVGAGLISMSGVPKSRWANLNQLSEIKRRNKPIEPPKAPKNAPFFLPTVAGLKAGAFTFGEDVLADDIGSSKVLNFGKIGAMSSFQKALATATTSQNYVDFATTMKAMGLSELDLEIRSLSVENDGEQLWQFLDFLKFQLAAKKDFELTQAYLSLFIQSHGEILSASESFAPLIQQTLKEQVLCWTHLEALFQHSLCAVNFLKGTI
eukprot:m.22878 g.22878  ORF g.22878 m.22878 type:complete len:897 (+) comp13988_c0_seq1:127-2817(+)